MANDELTQKYVRSLFNYRDGELYWKVARQGRKLGVPAGGISLDGYRVIRINGKLYRSHRLIFLYHHGYLPEFQIGPICNWSWPHGPEYTMEAGSTVIINGEISYNLSSRIFLNPKRIFNNWMFIKLPCI